MEVPEDQELQEDLFDAPVVDDAAEDETVKPAQYEITSFGADYDAEGLVKRLQREDVFIPPFQRDYVWSQREASRFIESLLLGLPVPGVFFARESDSKKLLVIDGQQRLKTLRFFFEGVFDPDPEAGTQRVFRLVGVQSQYLGRTYETLDEKDRITLNDSIIHATIVKQDSPEGEQSSIYHIFERLNNSGRKLSPQQIRVAIYHGDFVGLVRDLNSFERWRAIFGKRSKSLKDQELILRFLALHFDRGNYARPMNEFINDFVGKLTTRNRNADKDAKPSLQGCKDLFHKTIDLVFQAIGPKAFRPERALNAAVFDAVMVGLASRIGASSERDLDAIRQRYDALLANPRFAELTSRATADEKNVEERIKLSLDAFSGV